MKNILDGFKRMTLTKKIVFSFFCFYALLSILEGHLIATIISGLIAYCVYKYSKLQELDQPTTAGNLLTSNNSDEDEYRIQQQAIQDEAARMEEEQRMEDERIANQEGLDRLL